MKRVVVIGAGMGGLASAARLAAAGVSVDVVEALPDPGGKAGRTWIDGVRCDTGPSVLTMPDVLDDLFQAAGRENPVQLRRVDPNFRYRWPDGVTLDVFHAPEDTLASVRAALGAGPADQLRAFLGDAKAVWDVAGPAFVYGPSPGPQTFWRMGVGRLWDLRHLDVARTMDQAIRARVHEPHLVDLLRRYATYNGSDPRSAPATLNCIAWVELGLGCYGVEGGMSALVDHLVALVTDLGGRIHLGRPVRRLRRAPGGRWHVDTDEATVDADAVVANADVAHLARLTDGVATPKLPPSTSGFTALLAAPVADRAPHEVWFPRRYDGEFEDLFDRRRAPAEPTVYVCAQDRAHAVGRWGDREPLFVMANAPAAPSDDADLDTRTFARAGLDPADVRWRRTPADLAERFPDTAGALYGVASNSMFAAFLRPPNRLGSPAGLYVASGSAHPGGGVPLCLLSGRQAARDLLEDLR